MNKLMLIDGNSLLYRAYYGTAYNNQNILTNSQGMPVNAVLTFSRMLWRLIESYNPTHLFIAFDAGKETFRHQKLPSYKANRKQTPKELLQQIPLIKEMLKLMSIAFYQKLGIEADDLIGTLVKKYSLDNKMIIVSSDKDLYQLVNKNTSVVGLSNSRQPDKVINMSNFQSLLGYKPSQVIDIKALAGDASDNLKGVNGIGIKGAIKLVQNYGNLINIYQNIESLTKGLQSKLNKDKNQAFLCQEMATIKLDVDIPLNLDDFTNKIKITSQLIAFYEQLEINSLAKMLRTKQEMEKLEKQDYFDNIIL